jgi:hypothetical protein
MNHGFGQQVGPVIVSILVIIVVAILRSYSRTLAAITSTMPVVIPLSIWITYAGTGSDRGGMVQFMETLFLSMIGTVLFVVAGWLMARAGFGVAPMIAVGYIVWGLTLVVLLGGRYLLRG